MSADPKLTVDAVANVIVQAKDPQILGLYLPGLKKELLQIIEKESSHDQLQLASKISNAWINNGIEVPTWEKLIIALEVDIVGEKYLAEKVRSDIRSTTSTGLSLTRSFASLSTGSEDADITEYAKNHILSGIKQSFKQLTNEIEANLESKNITVSTVKSKIVIDKCRHFYTQTKHLRKIKHLFRFFEEKKFWSYDHYDLVRQVVAIVADETMQKLLDAYIKKLNGYQVAQRLASKLPYYLDKEYPERLEDKCEKFESPFCNDLRRKLGVRVNISNESLQFVDKLWDDIRKRYSIPCLTALLYSIVFGSLEITWLIQPSSACCILSELSASAAFLEEHLIMNVTLDDECIYDEHSGFANSKVICSLWMKQAILSDRIEKLREVLAQPDVDMNATLTEDGATPLIIASQCGHEDLVSFLIEAGADTTVTLANGETAFVVALKEGHYEIVKILHRYGATTFNTAEEGESPLVVAAGAGHTQVVEHFLEIDQEMNPDTLNFEKKSATLFLAIKGEHFEIVDRLLQSKFKKEIIDSEDSDGMTPLVLAVLKQSPKLVDMLMTAGADPNLANRDGMTSLMLAAEAGQVDSVRLLVEKGAEVTLPHEMSGKTALHFASENGHTDVVELLALPEHQALAIKDNNDKTALDLAKNSEIKTILKREWPFWKRVLETAKKPFQSIRKYNLDSNLITACKRGDVEQVKLCLQKKANVDALDILRWTGLMRAAHNGHDEVVKLMLEHGANPDSKDIGGWTALILASRKGYFKVVRHLVDHGADVSLSNWQGWTALMWAAQSIGKQNKTKEALLNRIETAKIILEKDAASVVDKRANDQWTPLMQACQDGNTGLVELLVEKGANTELFNPKNWTPLMIATTKDRTDVVKALVERGAKGEHRNDKEGHGMSALHVACVKGRDECLRIMVEPAPGAKCQVDLEIKDKWGMTPLMMATKNGNEKCIEILVENGADVNTKSKQYAGWSPLFFAIKEGHLKIAKLLLANKASMTTKDQYEQTPLGFAFSHKKDIYQSLISFLQGKPQELKAIRATGEATTIKTSTPHTQATSLSPTLDTPTQLVQGEGTEAAPPTTAAQTEVPGATETDTTPAQLDQLIQQAKSSARSAVSTNMKDIERKHRNYMTQAMQSGRTAASAA